MRNVILNSVKANTEIEIPNSKFNWENVYSTVFKVIIIIINPWTIFCK